MTTTTIADTGAWFGLLRELHSAGWRHRIVPPPNYGPDAPEHDEIEWNRGVDGEVIRTWRDSIGYVGYLNYCPDTGAGDPDGMDVSPGITAARGPGWLREAMILAGILPLDRARIDARKFTLEVLYGEAGEPHWHAVCRDADGLCEWSTFDEPEIWRTQKRGDLVNLGQITEAAEAHVRWHIETERSDAIDDAHREPAI